MTATIDMAWEAPFEDRILRSREVELKQVKRSFMLEVAFQLIWTISPMICVLVSFLWYTKVSHQVLTPSVAFTSLGASVPRLEGGSVADTSALKRCSMSCGSP